MKNKRSVVITGPGFEDSEVICPYYRLQEAGIEVDIATSTDKEVKGKHGYLISPTVKIEQLDEENYDGVVIPGGHEAPDRVRQIEKILNFVREMYETGKIVSSICHGPWVLISAGIMKDKKATCYVGMKDDLINAGAKYEEKSVVVDENIVTSDHPRHLAKWMRATVKKIREL